MGKHASKIRRRQLNLLIAFCALTLLSAACLVSFSALGHSLPSQQAAARFKGGSEERFEQVSVFFPVGKETDEAGVYTFRGTLEKKLTEAFLEAPESGGLYRDAYSAPDELSVTGPRGAATAPVLGVGGDFFLFHPLRLLSGGYITGEDLMHDRVVLDEELAWKLFGGSDVAGLTVTISDKPYLVAGVVRREEDFADRRAYTAGAGFFMAFDALSAAAGTGIGCYELVCASPVTGFVGDIAAENFSQAVTVENSRRFKAESIFGVIGDFGGRSMNTAGGVVPHWENAARLLEDYLALLLLLSLLFGLFPAACAGAALVIGLRRLTRRGRAAMPALRDRMEERAWKRREARHAARKNDERNVRDDG
jgi:hypothetical protein